MPVRTCCACLKGSNSRIRKGENVASECPIGSIVMYGGTKDNLSSDWLYCDGRVVSQAEYPILFKAVGHAFGNIGEHPGYDPGTQFYLPDLRGRFIRGVDDGSSRDPDLAMRTDMQSDKLPSSTLGSVQADEFRQHTHTYSHLRDEHSGIAGGDYWKPGDNETTPAGGKETRPLNAALYFIIRVS
jgi:microcystin-dependent protein